MKDMLWEAALAWWHDRKPNDDVGPFTIGMHVDNPTVGCTTQAERALALAVATRLQLKWMK